VVGYGSALTLRQRFTGKERDAETGLDFMEARYYSGAQGRFTSPDEPLFDQQAGDPQSWNLYAYGRNNPLRYLDPTGRKCVETSNGPADDGTGGGCAAAGVDANGNIQSQQVNVTAQQGSLLAAIGIGAFIGVSNAANDYFAWMFSSRPATLQNIDPGNNRATTTAAMIAPSLSRVPKAGRPPNY
jgi:RHS repeat-associated protein